MLIDQSCPGNGGTSSTGSRRTPPKQIPHYEEEEDEGQSLPCPMVEAPPPRCT